MNSALDQAWNPDSSTLSTIEHIPLVDRDTIDQLTNDIGQGAAASLIELFASEAWLLVNLVHDALKQEDLSLAATKAHGLKGSSATFGARQLASAAETLEQTCQSGDRDKAMDMIIRLPILLDETITLLTAIPQYCKPKKD